MRLGADFLELCRVSGRVRSKLWMFQPASEVPSLVSLMDVAVKLAQACQSLGGQVSICQSKWFLAFHLCQL